jgi:hypothetical protein
MVKSIMCTLSSTLKTLMAAADRPCTSISLQRFVKPVKTDKQHYLFDYYVLKCINNLNMQYANMKTPCKFIP